MKRRNRYESHRLMSYMNASNKAFGLAFHELLGDAGEINRETEKYMSVTESDMAGAAKQTFSPENCSVIYYLPQKR
ncbi:MAG: hypothetical protein R2756_05435 [Bacteroidales bacterium]